MGWCQGGGGAGVGGLPRFWVPACAGMTRAGGPSTGSGRTDSQSVPTVFGSRGCEWLVVGVPSPARVWVRAFAGMTRAGGPSTGSVRTELRIAPTTGGRSAGKSVVGGGGPAPAPAPRVLRPPRPRPSGYRLSPVRRWGELGRRRRFGSSLANEQCSVPNGLHVIA